MSQASAIGPRKWMEEPTMPMVEGLLASGLINQDTRVKLKEINPNLKDEYQNHNFKKTNKVSSKRTTSTSCKSKDGSKKSTKPNEGQESYYQKRKLLKLDQSSRLSHTKAKSTSLSESTSNYLSFVDPPPNFHISNDGNTNLNQYYSDDNNVSIGIPIDQLLLTKKRCVGKREIQRLLSDYMNKKNAYMTTIANTQMCKNDNDELNDPSFQYKELKKMLDITFATWNTAITTIRGYSDEYARLLYEIKKFYQTRVEKFPEIIAKYDEKIADLNSANDFQKETIDQINITIANKDNEINTLRKKMNELSLKITHLEIDKEEMNNRINDAEYMKEHIEEEYNTAVFKITKYEEEKKQSLHVLQSTQELLESCQNQIAHQETVIGKYEEEGASFRPLYTRAAYENQQYVKELNDLREQMKNMVVKQVTVSVEVQTNPVKIGNETKSKRNLNASRSTKKSSKKIRKLQSTINVGKLIEKYDPTVLNSTAAATPEPKKKMKKPSSTSKKVTQTSIMSPTNTNKFNNNASELMTPDQSLNPSSAVSPLIGEYIEKKQGILKSSDNFSHIVHCVSFDSVSDIFDISRDTQLASSQVSFARDPSNITFTNFKATAEDIRLAKSQAIFLNKGNEKKRSKCKTTNPSATLSPIISQSQNCTTSETVIQEESSACPTSNASPMQYQNSNTFQSPIPKRLTFQSPSPTSPLLQLPVDYVINEGFYIDAQLLVSCAYRLLPLPLGTSSKLIHQADPLIESVIRTGSGNISARSSDQCNVPTIKSFNWLIQRIIDFFHSVINLDKTSSPTFNSVAMLRAVIAENTKIESLSERILQDLIKTAMLYQQVPIVSVFLKVVTYEITTDEYKFLNMLFNIAFEFIYPKIGSLLANPELTPNSPTYQFLIHRDICNDIASKIFGHFKKEVTKMVNSITSCAKWPDMIDFWEFALKMITLFTKTHKQFQRQIRAILTLVRLNTNQKENITNNDDVIVTKQNFNDFMVFIRPTIKTKEIDKLYNRFNLECQHKTSVDSPVYNHKYMGFTGMYGKEEKPPSNTQLNFIRFCSAFPEITEDILALKFKEDFHLIYYSLTTPLQTLLQFIFKRFTEYAMFTQPRLLNPLLDMTKPVLLQMRNALLRCDTSMAFSCYRHVLQLIDLKCSEACPFTIFNEKIKIEAVDEVIKLVIAREKIAASHIFATEYSEYIKNMDGKEAKKNDINNDDASKEESQTDEENQNKEDQINEINKEKETEKDDQSQTKEDDDNKKENQINKESEKETKEENLNNQNQSNKESQSKGADQTQKSYQTNNEDKDNANNEANEIREEKKENQDNKDCKANNADQDKETNKSDENNIKKVTDHTKEEKQSGDSRKTIEKQTSEEIHDHIEMNQEENNQVKKDDKVNDNNKEEKDCHENENVGSKKSSQANEADILSNENQSNEKSQQNKENKRNNNNTTVTSSNENQNKAETQTQEANQTKKTNSAKPTRKYKMFSPTSRLRQSKEKNQNLENKDNNVDKSKIQNKEEDQTKKENQNDIDSNTDSQVKDDQSNDASQASKDNQNNISDGNKEDDVNQTKKEIKDNENSQSKTFNHTDNKFKFFSPISRRKPSLEKRSHKNIRTDEVKKVDKQEEKINLENQTIGISQEKEENKRIEESTINKDHQDEKEQIKQNIQNEIINQIDQEEENQGIQDNLPVSNVMIRQNSQSTNDDQIINDSENKEIDSGHTNDSDIQNNNYVNDENNPRNANTIENDNANKEIFKKLAQKYKFNQKKFSKYSHKNESNNKAIQENQLNDDKANKDKNEISDDSENPQRAE